MDSLTTLITNSTFKPALANGFHTLKLSGEQHKALKSLVEENAELKKKLEHKEDKIEDHLASCNFYEEQCQELKQEIKELDSYAKKHEQDNRILRFSTIGMTEEIDKLKEKNNKWTYWASDVIYWCNTHNKDILQSKKLIDGENKPTIDNVRDFGKEITELKEENSILRDINQKRIPALIRRWNEEDAEENEKLKEEIKRIQRKDGYYMY